MYTLTWNSELEIQIDAIDAQHKKLIQLLSDFYEAYGAKQEHQAVFDLLNGMLDYADYHFKTEEKYMKRYNYPHTTEHEKEHIYFKKETEKLQQKFLNSRFMTSLQVTNFMRDWIFSHIKEVDGKLGEFLRSKNLGNKNSKKK